MTLPRFACVVIRLLILAGCSSSTPRLYTVELRPGAVHNESPGVVTVRSFGVSRYLERTEIVRASGPGQLVASDNDWWAEPLRVMLRRVVVDDLGQRLPNSEVLGGDGTISPRSDAEVQFDLQRFELDDTNTVTMVGYVAVERADARTIDRLRLSLPAFGSTARHQVSAMSVALGQAADIVAARLAQRPAR